MIFYFYFVLLNIFIFCYMIHHFGGVFFINMLRCVKNMLNILPIFYIFLLIIIIYMLNTLFIILFILILIAFYQLGKQTNIINNQKKRNANNNINDINTIINKLRKGKF